MKLGELKPTKGAVKDTKRRGRGHGTGLGRTGGRGEKGYHSRSGSKQLSWFEGGQMPLQRRLPRRGFSNSMFKKSFQVVNLTAIEKLKDKDIDGQVMQDNGLVRSALQPIKILANGDISRKVNVTASAFSATAKEKIEKAGGSVTIQ
ncbi:MAG: 50S ribosomal protein L15 [Candidatus Marinimicrobia bacterium]|jgi:large subunit ribosomal protein L15|nr:50S ribosomal protein L15 [Candidatus Neomarinimicrobiota bacterium]|tara:strand:- start:84 stop:524 length:441 start_codon:yes stop_codon:yes gene_type:complete